MLFTRANGATTVLDLTIGAVGKDGAPGAPGAPGTSVTVAALPTGDSHCPNGGASFTDGSGSVAYACTGGAEPVCTRGGMCIGTNNACAYDKDCAATNYGGACQWTQASARFVDNGNGTVTDRRTCLTWEKKRGTVDPLERYSYCPGGRTCSDPRNVNNIYSWSVGTPWSFDGSVLTDFLKKLNDEAFAGHTDWRIPTSAGANTRETGSDPELESIILSWESSCSPPCIDPIFGPTLAYFYWSSSIDGESPPRAWAVDFANMMVIDETRNEIYPVRAVRGGP